jgi:hypothetical protein
MKPRRALLAAILAVASAGASTPGLARADDAVVHEAVRHFERGVSLFNEADYRAALVEFRRAYEIAPNPGVLYNIAQTQFQLQNYAGALVVFERFLAEAPANVKHRDDAQNALPLLRARVGKIEVSTNVPDAEISVDDEVIGKAPLGKPVLVSVGRRKVTASYPGRVPISHLVEVAAGDTAPVSLLLPDVEPAAKPPPLPHAAPAEPPPHPRGISGLATGGWVFTGVLAAGGAALGILAIHAAGDLATARNTFPTTRSNLDQKSSTLMVFSAAADALGAAAIVAGGVSIYLTISSRGPVKLDAAAAWNSVSLRGSF